MTVIDVSGGGFDEQERRRLEVVSRAPREEAVVPKMDTVSSLVGMGPMPVSKVVKVHALVREANRLGRGSEADGQLSTPLESVVRRPVIAKAEKFLERMARGPAAERISTIKKIFGQINLRDAQIKALTEREMTGPDGERLSVKQTESYHEELRGEIKAGRKRGAVKFMTERRRRWLEIGLVALDFPLFLLAMTGMLNVNFALAFSGSGPHLWKLVTAVLFAVFGTVLYAYLNRDMGRRHRRFKSDDSTLNRQGAVGKRLAAEQIALAAATVFVLLVMGSRVYSEAREGSPMLMAGALAVLFAVLVGLSGYVNYRSEFDNGSDEQTRLRQLSAQLLVRSRGLELLRADRAQLIEQAGLQLAALDREITDARARAVKLVVGSSEDKAITLARSYQGSTTLLEDPIFTVKQFDLAEEQAKELAAHHAMFTTRADSEAGVAVDAGQGTSTGEVN